MSFSPSTPWIERVPSGFWRGLGVGACLFAGYGIWQYGPRLLALDPFQGYRFREIEGLPDTVAASLQDVTLTQFEGGKVTAKANVDKVWVYKDRVTYELKGIKNGEVRSKEGPVRFTATQANYNSVVKELNLVGGVRVSAKDIAIQTEQASINQNNRMVVVPSATAGTLDKGRVRIASMNLNYETMAFQGRQGQFVGQLPAVQDVPVPATNNRTGWTVSADRIEDTGSETRISTYFNATATDGEVLVKAPKVQIDRRTNVLTATGRVFYYSAKANFVADKVVIYRRERRAVMTGNIVMLIKPKEEQPNYRPAEEEIPPFQPLVPDDVKNSRPAAVNGPSAEEKELDRKLRSGETIRDYPTLVTCREIEYFYRRGERRAKIMGDPQARQTLALGRWRHAWAYEGFYDGEAETLRLFSRAGKLETRMKTSVGDDLTARSVLLYTREGDERFSAEAGKGTVIAEDDDDLPTGGGNGRGGSTGGSTTGGGPTSGGTTSGGTTSGGTSSGGTTSGGTGTTGSTPGGTTSRN